LVILIIWPILAAVLSLLFKVNAFGSIILFLFLPAVYLSVRGIKYMKKSLIFSLVVGIPGIIIVEYLAHLSDAWLVPFTIFPIRLFGFVTIESILWAFFLIYYIIMFYEYFLDKHVAKHLWHPHMKYLAMLVLLGVVVFLVLLFYSPNVLKIPYFYLCFGILLILIPIIIELFTYSRLSSKFFKAAAYFFFMTFIYEVTSLKLGIVAFPGTEFIGWVSILGVSFPFEELFFWCMLFTLAALSYYEFFDDDEK